MARILRTLLLSATALGALGTAAVAAPSKPPPTDTVTTGMHTRGATQTSHGSEAMTGMHTAMPDARGAHDAMLDDPAMQAHMAEYGLNADQMRQWHEAGTSVARMHGALAELAVDVDAMQADCPMLTDASMNAMHRDGGHHAMSGGDRA